MLDCGCRERIPVRISNAAFYESGPGVVVMSTGNAYITEPYIITDAGITLVSLIIPAGSGVESNPKVSGYVECMVPGQNLIGDFGVFEFENVGLGIGCIQIFGKTTITYDSTDYLHQYPIEVRENMYDIPYQQYIFRPVFIEINLNANRNDPSNAHLFTLRNGTVYMKSPLETLANEGFVYNIQNPVQFDLIGEPLTGTINTAKEQSVQLLVPGGSALRMLNSTLHFKSGDISGSFNGKLILPFEEVTADFANRPVLPGEYVNSHPYKNNVDYLIDALESLQKAGEITDDLRIEMTEGLIKFGKRVQQNGLLICPSEFDLQDMCASVAIRDEAWDGQGLIVWDTILTPVNVVERSLGKEIQGGTDVTFGGTTITVGGTEVELQRVQGILLEPTTVSLDLDRRQSFTRAEGSMTPTECGTDAWVGIIIKGGKLSLPKEFIETTSGGAVEFELKEGELLYDLNGFNYQTYLFAAEKNGVPAQFGDQLGSFADVMIHDCMLDLYANRVNIEINCTVTLDVLNGHDADAKLYSDDVTGRWLCSVAPTEFTEAEGTGSAFIGGYDMIITGGWFKYDGIHINGWMILPDLASAAEVKSDNVLCFTDLIIPPQRHEINANQRKYGSVNLDIPVVVDFNGFAYTVRDMKLECFAGDGSTFGQNRLTLYGATLLGNSIPLLSETTDKIVLESILGERIVHSLGPARRFITPPDVLYDLCETALQNNFDESLEFTGKLKPKATIRFFSSSSGQGDDGLVEYIPSENEPFSMGFLNSLDLLPMTIHARFGIDKRNNDRNFYAIGFQLTVPIPLGPGKITGAAGIVTSNMVVEEDSAHQDRFAFANAANMGKFIADMPVHRGVGSTFAAGLRGKLIIAEICVVDNMYFGFTNGPVVEAGGDLYIVLSLDSIMGGGINEDGSNAVSVATYLGDVVVRYHHPNRHFSANIAFDMELVGIQITGNVGFEVSPSLFRIYVGYPDALTGSFGFNAGTASMRIAVSYGLEYQIGGEHGAHARQKQRYDAEAHVNVAIVYVDVSAYIGGEGMITFKPAAVSLEVALGGKIVGGIWFFGKHDIIRLQLDAMGKMTAQILPKPAWRLQASCRVSYSINLGLLGSCSGTETVSLDKTISL